MLHAKRGAGTRTAIVDGATMTKHFAALLLAATIASPAAWAADARGSLLDVPVADAGVIAPAQYGKASDLASRGGAPIEIALAVAGAFEGSTQHVVQVNEGSESPTASRVTVLRDGLLDDSVRGERWDITLERTATGGWRIKEVTRAWRCRRGAQIERFATTLCP